MPAVKCITQEILLVFARTDFTPAVGDARIVHPFVKKVDIVCGGGVGFETEVSQGRYSRIGRCETRTAAVLHDAMYSWLG